MLIFACIAPIAAKCAKAKPPNRQKGIHPASDLRSQRMKARPTPAAIKINSAPPTTILSLSSSR